MIFLADSDFQLHQGDALEVLGSLLDGSVHMCVTSPPFYGLRDYGAEGQIGLEQTPDEYVARLVEVFREVRRVLRADGTCWVEMGDSYAAGHQNGQLGTTSTLGQARGQGTMDSVRKRREAIPDAGPRRTPGYKPKDLLGIPWLVAFALRADGWWLRSDIVWARPNPMPESVTDRPTKSHSYVFLLSKSARYFFDQEVVREALADPERKDDAREGYPSLAVRHNGARGGYMKPPSGARNVRSVWTIPTQPLADEHYAAFPERLAERCILAGTSERGVCPECGAPWQRQVDVTRTLESGSGRSGNPPVGKYPDGLQGSGATGDVRNGPTVHTTTTGWQRGCAHDAAAIPATVLDPFIGSGTTALVARRHGRRTIGIELSPEYCAIAARRTQQLALYS